MEISAPAAGAALDTSPRAFRGFYDDALPRVYGYFLHRCGGSVHVAEDLTQETFLAVVAELKKDRPVATPIPWIYGIARHKLLDHYRSQEQAERGHEVAWNADETEHEPVVPDNAHARERAVRALVSVAAHPHFPPGIFRVAPPPGSHNLDKLEQNPYYKTKLAPGKPAPNWHATTLAGKPFQLTDLHGKPTLVALLADWCTPCTNDFAPLEQAYQHSNGATTVIWVDAGGKAQEAKKLARLNHLTFPGVVDKGAVHKAWDIQSVPMWVLLDPRGRVIEARLGPQTVAQLQQLLATG